VDLGFQSRAQGDELGPVADQLPQCPDFGWSNTRLGQPSSAQKVGQVGGVALVVLDPALASIVPERVGRYRLTTA
jgi:hypothetical protein